MLFENLISGHAYKLGDVLTYKNGVTVEVVNTDAEGRLVLADGLMAATETGAPLIIDAATLTGAAVVALGSDYHGVFSLDDNAREQMLKAAKAENERFWPLPLEDFHAERCPSAFADTANSRPMKGGGGGGASNAAGFLSRFVKPEGWVHLDLAAAYHGETSEMPVEHVKVFAQLRNAERLQCINKIAFDGSYGCRTLLYSIFKRRTLYHVDE